MRIEGLINLHLKTGARYEREAHQPAAPNAELITALDVVLRYSFRSDAWPKVIEAIGSVKLREIIEALKTVYDTHCDKSAVKTKADRAEAKAARIIARAS